MNYRMNYKSKYRGQIFEERYKTWNKRNPKLRIINYHNSKSTKVVQFIVEFDDGTKYEKTLTNVRAFRKDLVRYWSRVTADS